MGKTRARTVYAPTKDRICFAVLGLGQVEREAIRCGLALMVPDSQIHPKMVVFRGAMIVLDCDRYSPLCCRACRTLVKFLTSSSGRLPPQYRSSASLVTMPSSWSSPKTQHISSSNALSDPGMPIAQLAYTLVPSNGVTTPQYFMEACAKRNLLEGLGLVGSTYILPLRDVTWS